MTFQAPGSIPGFYDRPCFLQQNGILLFWTTVRDMTLDSSKYFSSNSIMVCKLPCISITTITFAEALYKIIQHYTKLTGSHNYRNSVSVILHFVCLYDAGHIIYCKRTLWGLNISCPLQRGMLRNGTHLLIIDLCTALSETWSECVIITTTAAISVTAQEGF